MILNLTQHKATPEQVEAGVVDLPETERAELSRLLTFDELPSSSEITDRAKDIAELVLSVTGENGLTVHQALVGGAPFLMSSLEAALRWVDLEPVYAFSRRESVETITPDGAVLKTAVFKHQGFVRLATVR